MPGSAGRKMVLKVPATPAPRVTPTAMGVNAKATPSSTTRVCCGSGRIDASSWPSAAIPIAAYGVFMEVRETTIFDHRPTSTLRKTDAGCNRLSKLTGFTRSTMLAFIVLLRRIIDCLETACISGRQAADEMARSRPDIAMLRK